MLASVGKVLIVIDPKDQRVLHVQLLDPAVFPQPEGMTFDANDNLLISSEGLAGQPASITRFNPVIPKKQ